jgi:hypothetical protein
MDRISDSGSDDLGSNPDGVTKKANKLRSNKSNNPKMNLSKLIHFWVIAFRDFSMKSLFAFGIRNTLGSLYSNPKPACSNSFLGYCFLGISV